MPAEFQKTADYTLVGLQNTYCFLDDNIIVSTGSESDHLSYVIKCLKKLFEDNWRINLQKCLFAKTEIDWLGYKFILNGISPLENKSAAILAIPPPTALNCLRSLLGSVHYNIKIIPNLAQICQFLESLTGFYDPKDTPNISISQKMLQAVEIATIIPNWTFK